MPDVFVISQLPELNIQEMENAESPLPTRMCTKDLSLENPLQRET